METVAELEKKLASAKERERYQRIAEEYKHHAKMLADTECDLCFEEIMNLALQLTLGGGWR